MHDLNNQLVTITINCALPLEVVSGTVPPLDDGVPGEQRRSDLEAIKCAADRATALVQSLAWAGQQHGVEPRILDVNVIVRGVEQMLRRPLIVEGIIIDLDIGPGLEHVRADAAQLEHMLMNLAVNARDAMPGGGTVTLRTANVDVGAIGEPATRHSAARVRDADRRGHWLRRGRPNAGAHLRALLHDEGTGQGERTRSRGGVRHREAVGRLHLRRQHRGLGIGVLYLPRHRAPA